MSLKVCGIPIVMDSPYDYRIVLGTIGIVDTETNIGYAVAHSIIGRAEIKRLRDYEKQFLIGTSVWHCNIDKNENRKDNNCNLSVQFPQYGYERKSIGVVLGFDDFGVIISLKNISDRELSQDIKPGYAVPNTRCYIYDVQNNKWDEGIVTYSSNEVVNVAVGFKYNIKLKSNGFLLKSGCSGSPVLQGNRVIGQICGGSAGCNTQPVYVLGIMNVLNPDRLIA